MEEETDRTNRKKTANSKSYSQLSVVYKTCSFNEKRALTYMLQVEVKYTVWSKPER